MHSRFFQWCVYAFPAHLFFQGRVVVLESRLGLKQDADLIASLTTIALFHGTASLIPLLSASIGFVALGVFLDVAALKKPHCVYRSTILVHGLLLCAKIFTPYSYLDRQPTGRLHRLVRQGCAPAYLSVRYTFRYTMMRSFSFCMETGMSRRKKSPSNQHRYGYKDFLRYIAFFPLYLNGPLMPFCEFQRALSERRPHQSKHYRVLLSVSCDVLLFGAVYDLLYDPGALFADSVPLLNFWLAVKCFILLSFLESHIPFSVAWLSSAIRGVEAVVDTPASVFECTESINSFFRRFHVSWKNWLHRYFYRPSGGGITGILICLFVSLALHDFEQYAPFLSTSRERTSICAGTGAF